VTTQPGARPDDDPDVTALFEPVAPPTSRVGPALAPREPARPPPADPGPVPAAALALRDAYGLTFTAAQAMHRLGMVPGDLADRWIEPKLSHLTPPDAMADRGAAAERIASAIRRGERICVFGDYDCDGITSAAVMTSVIRGLGGEAVPLLATRTEGAYGLSGAALARVRAASPTLLVTCDCGSSDHDRIADAKRAGVDTVVIDHHLVPAEKLPALAFLNPHRDECGFAFKHLASCGLALSVGAAVRQALGQKLDLRPLLDLVAIGTIADVVPLVGDNRALTRAGLRVLSSGGRPGLRALAELARLDLSFGVTSEDVAFRIEPRINAPGRLADPDEALALLLTQDRTAANGLAAAVEQLQSQRRALQGRLLEEALVDLEDGGFAALPGAVLARQGWHPGIIGIVAGKVAERTGKPTIVVGLEGATGRGSVRGPPGFPLYDALVMCRGTLEAFGGHQAAAGLTVRADRVEALRAGWSDACARLAHGVTAAEEEAAARLDSRDDPARVLADLERFEPFGADNPQPLIFCKDARVVSARDVKGHLKLELRIEGRHLVAIAFSMGEAAGRLQGRSIDAVGTLRRNTFRGGAELHVRSFEER
jgi:single-stranded-DNA-specific exonuclease